MFRWLFWKDACNFLDIKLFFSVSFLLFAFNISAQLVANFEAQSGYVKPDGSGIVVCKPDEVTFKSTSTFNGNPITFGDPDYKYEWIIQPNPIVQTQESPSQPFTQVGSFNVQLKITHKPSGASETIVKSGYVEVVEKPKVDFEIANNEGCIPLDVVLTDKTVLSGPISATYEWVISGAGSGSGTNPTIVVNQTGLFNVSLVVTDEYGCRGDLNKPSLVNAKPQPKAGFTVDNAFACKPPLDFTLTATETDPNFNYTWSITGFPNQNGRQISGSIGTPGSYDVSLLVDGQYNCRAESSESGLLVISELDPFFEVNQTICPGGIANFKFRGKDAETFSWNFGDGGISDKESPNYRYTTPGTYNACLTVTGNNNRCDSTFCLPITVEDISAEFELPEINPCQVPQDLTFDVGNSKIPDGSTVVWTVNGGQSKSGNQVTYTFDQYRRYRIRLVITSPSGCVRAVEKEFKLTPIQVFLNVQDLDGCAPHLVNANDISNYGGVNVVKREWIIRKMPSGNIIFTTNTPNDPNLQHTIAEHGDYELIMLIELENGCTSGVTRDIQVGIKPTAEFNFFPQDTCAQELTLFRDTSYVLLDGVKRYDLIDSWFWVMGEGTFNEQHPEVRHTQKFSDTLNGLPEGHMGPGNMGRFDAELIVSYNGCRDTLKKFEIYGKWGPVMGTIALSQPCGSDTAYVMINSAGWTQRTWSINFTDPSKNDTIIIEQFPSYKDTVYNGMVVDALTHSQRTVTTDTLKIYAPAPEGFVGSVTVTAVNNAFNSANGCEVTNFIARGKSLTEVVIIPDELCYQGFSGKNSVFLESMPGWRNHKWFVEREGVLTYLDQNKSYTYTPPAGKDSTFEETIVVVFAYNSVCPDTVRRKITWKVPKVDVELESGDLIACAGNQIDVKATKSPGTNITKWEWILFNTGPNPRVAIDTIFEQDPGPIAFENKGTYFLYMKATDAEFCPTPQDLGFNITIRNPDINFSVDKVGYCKGEELKLTNNTNFEEDLDYKWFINGVNFSNDSAPSLVLTQVDTFDIKCIGFNATCVDSLERKNAISVDPIPSFAITTDSNFTNCPPLITEFSADFVEPYSGYIYKWDLGVGGSTLDTTIGFYDKPGTYDVSLIVTTPNGCSDTITVPEMIEIEGPFADSISVSDDAFCANDTFQLTVHGAINTQLYSWNFGDGISQQITPPDSTVKYAYDRGYSDPITVTLFLINGTCKVPYQKELIVDELTAFIEPLPVDTFCSVPQTLQFVSISQGANISNVEWDYDKQGFGPSDTKTYTDYGTFTTTLRVSDDATGCSDIDSIQLWIFEKPPLVVSPNDTLCFGETAVLKATGAMKYSWNPVLDLTDVSGNKDSSEVEVDPPTSREYTVTGIDTLTKCVIDKSVKIFRDSTFIDFNPVYSDTCQKATIGINYSANPPYVGNTIWDISGENHDFQTTNAITAFSAGSPDTIYFELSGYDKHPRCIQTKTKSVVIYPEPEVSIIADTVLCDGNSIVLFSSGGDTVRWDVNPPIMTLPSAHNPNITPTNTAIYTVTVTDTLAFCESDTAVEVFIDKSKADVVLTRIDTCGSGRVQFSDLGSIGVQFVMDWGNGVVDSLPGGISNEMLYSNVGVYNQMFIARDNPYFKTHCQDTLKWRYEVYDLPVAIAETPDPIICNYDTIQLTGKGGILYAWSPSESLSDTSVAKPLAFPDFNTQYQLIVTDVNNCRDTTTVEVDVVPEFIIDPKQQSDTINIGDFILLSFDVVDSLSLAHYDANINWVNTYAIDCATCRENNAQPLKTSDYTITVIDEPHGCYPKQFSFEIFVKEEYQMDIPSGFTPNNDDVNDRIFVRGLGIKELENFTIYNRWGEVVYQSSDLNEGWDGFYKGKVQNDETYVYQATVRYYNETTESKRGYITILK
ncbi:PKD domain-containing protein [Luteibaculum oceani]|uniref:PKD domain-containing protein n=1 Tax=Luteibaculum oceani TaxID=1294296 RepID=A0A5C6UUL1_9FLAO|nr:PKD domain-containing protein [Luteibaculum oceani]TXC77062.1 PKD domain-containing protein [Luteibaculum oceani]